MSPKEKYFKALEDWVNTYWLRALAEYFEYLKSTDISMQQAFMLTLIYHNGPCKISEICELTMVSAAATSQMVNRLEKLALVKRTTEPGDRRIRYVALSPKGEDLVRQSIAARQNWAKHIPPEFSDGQLDQISETLQLLTSIYKV